MSLKVNWLFKQRFNKLDSAHYRDLSTLKIDLGLRGIIVE